MNELLAIRRPGRLEQLFDYIPKPKGYLPRNALPMWALLPIANKIPTVEAPKGYIVYTRGTVGKSFVLKTKRDDFVFTDASGVKMPYEPLHDDHLKSFLRSKVTRKHLRKAGLMTEDGEEICTLDVFNEYRQYLSSVYGELVNRERARIEALSKERRLLAVAKEREERDAKKAMRRLARNEGALARKQMEEQLKKEMMKKRNQMQQKHEQWLAEYRREQQIKIMARSQALDKKIRECKAKSGQFSRERTVRTMRKWHTQENFARKQCREKNRRKGNKEQEIERRFHQKAEFQLKKLNLINQLLEREAEEKQRSMQERNLRFMKERERMNDLFQRIRHKKEEKIKMEKRRKISNLVTNVICKNLAPIVSDMQLNRKSVEETVNQAMGSFYATEEREANIAELLEETKSLLSKQSLLPSDVKTAIEQILVDSLTSVVKNKVELGLKDIISRGIQTIEIVAPKNTAQENGGASTCAKILTCPVFKRNDKFLCRHPTPTPEIGGGSLTEQKWSITRKSQEEQISLGFKGRSINAQSILRGVSFGGSFTIGTSSQEITVPELKSVKDRPPTPQPSVTDVAMVVFQRLDGDVEKENDKLNDSSGSSIVMKEKEDLLTQISLISKEISQCVYMRLQKELALHSERRSRSVSITLPEIVNHVTENIKIHGPEYTSMMEDLEWVASSLLNIILFSYWSVHYKVKVRTRPVSRSARCCFKQLRSSVLAGQEQNTE